MNSIEANILIERFAVAQLVWVNTRTDSAVQRDQLQRELNSAYADLHNALTRTQVPIVVGREQVDK